MSFLICFKKKEEEKKEVEVVKKSEHIVKEKKRLLGRQGNEFTAAAVIASKALCSYVLRRIWGFGVVSQVEIAPCLFRTA